MRLIVSFIENTYPQGSGIIYCITKKEADQVASDFVHMGINAAAFMLQ